MIFNFSVLGMNIPHCINQTISNVTVGLFRFFILYTKCCVDVGRLPNDSQNQLKIVGAEKIKETLHVLAEKTIFDCMLFQRPISESLIDRNACTISQQKVIAELIRDF